MVIGGEADDHSSSNIYRVLGTIVSTSHLSTNLILYSRKNDPHFTGKENRGIGKLNNLPKVRKR